MTNDRNYIGEYEGTIRHALSSVKFKSIIFGQGSDNVRDYIDNVYSRLGEIEDSAQELGISEDRLIPFHVQKLKSSLTLMGAKCNLVRQDLGVMLI